jgi:hypothetical protein
MAAHSERQALKSLYGKQWAARVDKMSDQQVIAIYLKFKSEGKIK